ncbi:MAG: class I SAM-dependent methyltransferase [Pseudomonadota bacterium]
MRAAVVAVCAVVLVIPQSLSAESVAPYVQTVEEDVELILDLAGVGPDDHVIDLGSGDGRFVIGAARRGATAQGVELQSELVALSRQRAQAAGVGRRAAFVEGDIFAADVADASVVVIYLFPEANLRLRPKLLAEMRPGARLVSNSFHMGDWRPDRRAQGRTSGGALLWVIPAAVGGDWRLSLGAQTFDLSLRQRYQTVEPAKQRGGDAMALSEVRLSGRRISFVGTAGERTFRFTGLVDGERMTGTAQLDDEARTPPSAWRARLIAVASPARG